MRWKKSLLKYLSFIEATEIEKAEEGINEVKERIDILFDLLEKEVTCQTFCHAK